MDDYIIGLIKDIISGVANLGSNGSTLLQTPQQFNKTLFDGVTAISKNAVMPIAYVILSLIFVFELYNITIRTEGQHGTMGVEIPFKVMFKLVVCKTFVDSTPIILGAIFQVTNQITMNIGSVFGEDKVTVANNLSAMKESIKQMSFSVKLMTSVQVTLIWLIFKFSVLIISLIIIGRMIEVYVMTAIAGIPLVTMANSEWSAVGKNFLKNFAAVCLQGVIIYIVLAMFGMLMKGIPTEVSNDNVTEVLFQAMLYVLVLVTAIFSSGRISKSICNAM